MNESVYRVPCSSLFLFDSNERLYYQLTPSLSLSLSLWLRNFNPIHDAFEQRENTGGQKQDAKFRRCLRIIEEDKIVIILSWKE